MKLTVIRTDNTDPYENLAAEEHLTFNVEEDEVILFLWQNAHTVVIGKNQNPWKECNVEQIKKDGAYLARRMSGGGAVYHDMGNLNFTFAARDGLYDISRQTEIILLACRMMGIHAMKTGRNDLTLDGKKFSGHAYYSSGGYNYHHGTIMIDVSSEDLPKYLAVSAAKLRSKGVDSVRSRVVNLREHLEKKMPGASVAEMVSAMQDALVRAAAREYGCSAEERELPAIPEELFEKYRSEEWRLGTRIPFSRELIHRFEWGEVQILLEMKGEYIKSCKVYSDSLETEIFPVLEELLTGCRYDAAEIMALKVPQGVSATSYELLKYIAASID